MPILTLVPKSPSKITRARRVKVLLKIPGSRLQPILIDLVLRTRKKEARLR
jgi:hypothetical protein